MALQLMWALYDYAAGDATKTDALCYTPALYDWCYAVMVTFPSMVQSLTESTLHEKRYPIFDQNLDLDWVKKFSVVYFGITVLKEPFQEI